MSQFHPHSATINLKSSCTYRRWVYKVEEVNSWKQSNSDNQSTLARQETGGVTIQEKNNTEANSIRVPPQMLHKKLLYE